MLAFYMVRTQISASCVGAHMICLTGGIIGTVFESLTVSQRGVHGLDALHCGTCCYGKANTNNGSFLIHPGTPEQFQHILAEDMTIYGNQLDETNQMSDSVTLWRPN